MTDQSSVYISIKKKLGALNLEYELSLSTGITVLFGDSGAGKSSLINLIAGLLIPDSGKIVIAEKVVFDSQLGINMKPHKRSIGYVFQDARLFPHMSVKKNLLYAKNARLNDHALELINLLGITSLMDRQPNSLSGGEKQRVAIARALLSNPRMLLLDEPFSSLDTTKKQELLNYFCKLVKHIDIPVIMVTHSKEEALILADHLVLIEEGRVLDHGSFEQVWNRKTLTAQKPRQKIDSQQNVVYTSVFVEQHVAYPMWKMQLLDVITKQPTSCFVWVDKASEEIVIGDTFRIQLNAQDISISFAKESLSSIRNRITCHIEQHQILLNTQGVLVTLKSVGNIRFLAKISLWAWEEMKLKDGLEVVAQIKSTSLVSLKQYSH